MVNPMRAVSASHGWWLGTLLAFAVLVLPPLAAAQNPPVKATLFFKNPPAGLVFSPTAPITIVLQLENDSPAAVNTTEGFSTEEHWRRLVFSLPGGGTVINTAGARLHRATQVGFCHSRGRVLQRPTAIPVVPIEVLAAGSRPPAAPPNRFFLEYEIDVRRFYELTRTGRHTVNARIPLLTFDTSDPTAVISNCDQFEGGTVVNVTALTGRQSFTVLSNSLEFVITQYQFVGFRPPIVNDTDAACAGALPCRTFRFGSTVPVKFQLLNEQNVVVGTAVNHIAVSQVSGTAPAQTPEDLGTGAQDTGNRFRFDPVDQHYIFNLDTKVLAPGVWRVDAIHDDGSVRSVHIGLR